MGLDARGDISIVIIIAYIPVFIFSLLLSLRHGFSRDAGWVFLLIFSVVRIVGGALHIAAEEISPPSIGVYIGAFALESSGVAPLLLCTTSFLGVIATHAISPLPFGNTRVFRLTRLVVVLAFILSIVGASQSASSDESTRNTAQTLRRVGAILLLAAFVVITFIHLAFWSSYSQILRHRRTLLVGISCALPFLAVRVLYSILSAFSPASTFGPTGPSTSESGLSKFNAISGSWGIFLGMSLLMEFVVVGIYIGFGTLLPLSEDDQYEGAHKGEEQELDYSHGTNYYQR